MGESLIVRKGGGGRKGDCVFTQFSDWVEYTGNKSEDFPTCEENAVQRKVQERTRDAIIGTGCRWVYPNYNYWEPGYNASTNPTCRNGVSRNYCYMAFNYSRPDPQYWICYTQVAETFPTCSFSDWSEWVDVQSCETSAPSCAEGVVQKECRESTSNAVFPCL